MREHFVLFSTTFVLTLLAIFILIPLAHKIGLVDKPHGRKQHVGSIPLIGGISIFTGVGLTLAWFGLPDNIHYYYLLCGGTIVILGVFDDFMDLSVKLRLCVQLLIGSAMVYGLQLQSQARQWRARLISLVGAAGNAAQAAQYGRQPRTQALEKGLALHRGPFLGWISGRFRCWRSQSRPTRPG